MGEVKESEVFLINNWEYRVVSDSKGKELQARLIHESLTFAGIDDWIIVSDISEMKLWRFNKLVDMLDDMGHSVAVIASVFAMEIVFTEEGDK